jgi:hypothetical protein
VGASPYINGMSIAANKKKGSGEGQSNSYSVDRKNGNQVYQEEYSAEKRQQDNLSFESLNPNNNSFTLGG